MPCSSFFQHLVYRYSLSILIAGLVFCSFHFQYVSGCSEDVLKREFSVHEPIEAKDNLVTQVEWLDPSLELGKIQVSGLEDTSLKGKARDQQATLRSIHGEINYSYLSENILKSIQSQVKEAALDEAGFRNQYTNEQSQQYNSVSPSRMNLRKLSHHARRIRTPLVQIHEQPLKVVSNDSRDTTAARKNTIREMYSFQFDATGEEESVAQTLEPTDANDNFDDSMLETLTEAHSEDDFYESNESETTVPETPSYDDFAMGSETVSEPHSQATAKPPTQSPATVTEATSSATTIVICHGSDDDNGEIPYMKIDIAPSEIALHMTGPHNKDKKYQDGYPGQKVQINSKAYTLSEDCELESDEIGQGYDSDNKVVGPTLAPSNGGTIKKTQDATGKRPAPPQPGHLPTTHTGSSSPAGTQSHFGVGYKPQTASPQATASTHTTSTNHAATWSATSPPTASKIDVAEEGTTSEHTPTAIPEEVDLKTESEETYSPTMQPTRKRTNAPTQKPTARLTPKPTNEPTLGTLYDVEEAEALPPNEPNAVEDGSLESMDLEEDLEEEVEKEEMLEQELEEQEREVRRIGGFGVFLAIVAMIFTAHQMSENPDGIYASCCRLIITLSGCAFKMALMPLRTAVGGNRGYGHLPVSSMDYGYRDPYRPGAGSMELS